MHFMEKKNIFIIISLKHVTLIFLHWDKKSYQLSEKCATLYSANPVMLTEFLQHNDNFLSGEV